MEVIHIVLILLLACMLMCAPAIAGASPRTAAASGAPEAFGGLVDFTY